MIAADFPEVKPVDHLVATGDPDSVALVHRSDVYSYKALNCGVAMLCKLLTQFGVVAGDRVASWSGKNPVTAIMPLAVARLGAVHVPVNPLLKAPQVQHILSDSGAKLMIANRSRLQQLGDFESVILQAIEDIALTPDDCVSSTDANSWLEPSNNNTDHLAAILYTSGSTGRPKGVMLSHANLWLGAVSVAQYLGLASDERTLCVLPLSFDYGQNQLLSTWYAGGACYLLDYLMPRDVVKACAGHAITTLAAVPPLWIQLSELDWPPEAVQSMRRLTNSGGALTEPLVRELQEIFTGSDIFAMYGLTEAFRSTFLPPEMIDTHPTSMGNAIPFAEIMLVDNDMVVEEAGEGELVHCGPLVAQGYWRDSKRTAERFKPAPEASLYGGMAVWSGDRVRRDGDGLLYFVGRRDAMIKTSGNRVSPSEIEAAAEATGLVAESVALGRPDERLGQAIILIARLSEEGLNEKDGKDAVLKALKRDLPNFMHPQEIELLEALPRNPNGKLDRTLLARTYAS